MALDRVTVESDDRAVGIRHATTTWDVFATHFPRKPVVPGVVIIGCLERLAQALLERRTGSADWRLAGIGRARFRHFVQPGDVMELVLEVAEVTDEAAVLKATVNVDGTAVTTFRTFTMRSGGGS